MQAKIIGLLLLAVHPLLFMAQTFTCEKLSSDIATWNELENNSSGKKEVIDDMMYVPTRRKGPAALPWAKAVMDAGLYSTDPNGSIEYIYIIQATDSQNISTLRKLTFDYLAYNFNIDNQTQANIETNSPKDGAIFTGILNELGGFNSGFEYNRVDANIRFDIRFKPNRIRFSVKIVDYKVLKLSSITLSNYKQVYVKDCYPFNSKSDHKKSYAMAFINANGKCMNYASQYVEYMNRNIVGQQPTEYDDW